MENGKKGGRGMITNGVDFSLTQNHTAMSSRFYIQSLSRGSHRYSQSLSLGSRGSPRDSARMAESATIVVILPASRSSASIFL